MKKFIILALSIFGILSFTFAQDKLLDKSGRQPKWVNGLEKDYIIVTGTGPTAQDAQQDALSHVKAQIVSSVAENVKATSEVRKEESMVNNNVSQFLEKFATSTATQSGKVPFLQGISISKVSEYYWEKRQRADKSVYFIYHLKYPFPESELKMLVLDFKMRDRELTQQLEDILAQVDNVETIEQIEKNISELKSLKEYFMDGRVDQCNLGITRYKSLLKSIELVEIESGLGELKYYLRLNGRKVSTAKKPTVRSECARVNSIINNPEGVTIKYNYENCYEDPENNIHVKYMFSGVTVDKRFYFDITANKASIFVSEPIHLNAISKDEESVNGIIIDMTVHSKYDSPFTIEKVVLEWKGLPPVVVENIGQSFQGKGNHQLKITSEQVLDAEKTSSTGKTLSLMSGFIHYRADATGELKTYRIYNQSYTTDW
ncbi:MAG: hypothetical protein PWR03_158 [Tenuifilum sp.]|uniref:hypothetical protein n=1 Tax=Tenuifilum sp. TaxID=2760880 RepID=UPI0024AB064A|nr:hypothetical protein [Tenuifilum sp.]MDI3525975.1 hypothetical protein [Tenuifilum sp.]